VEPSLTATQWFFVAYCGVFASNNVQRTIGLATLIYAVLAALQWLSLRYQIIFIRNQAVETNRIATASETSALATRDSADAVLAAERPYLVMKGFQMLEDRRHTREDGLVDLTVGFELWNYGPTPAWPEFIIVHTRAHRTANLEGEPLPDFADSAPVLLGGVIVPNERPLGLHEVSYPDNKQLCVTQAEWREVEQGTLNLFFYGVIQYHDGRGEQGNARHSVFGIRYSSTHPSHYWAIMNPNYWQHD
jgi:hypothetical protein